MIILDATTRTLEVLLDGAPSAQFPWASAYVDIGPGYYAAGSSTGATNSGSAVTILAAPASGRQRKLQFFSLFNGASAVRTVTLRYNDNGTTRILLVTTLHVGETLQYVVGSGFTVIDTTGAEEVSHSLVTHAASHQHGGADEVATATPGANAVPKATAGGKLDGWISDAASGALGLVELDTDLGGTNTAPQIVGWLGSALPANAADSFVKRNSGNSAWEAVTWGSGSNTVAQGNDSRLGATVCPNYHQRVFRPLCADNTSSNFTLVDGVAYWVFIGHTKIALTPQFVRFYATSAGSGGQTAEVGLFSTTGPPNNTLLEFTKLVATGTLTSLTGTGHKVNTTAFATVVGAGTYLWAGIRTSMASTEPTIVGGTYATDYGVAQSKAAAGALTGSGPWTADTKCGDFTSTSRFPLLWVTLD